jgi:hypothetical protein
VKEVAVNHLTSSILHVLAPGSQQAAGARRLPVQSPIVAMLWENWHLTRIEAAWHLAFGIVAASAVLVLYAALPAGSTATDLGAVIALILLVAPHVLGWFSINQLNLVRPGFPFYLLYARPVRTAAAVLVPMAYQALVPAVLYFVSALLLRNVSGYPFPLLPVAAWIVAINLATTALTWSIRNLVARILGSLVVAVTWSALGMQMLTVEDIPGPDLAPPHLWPGIFDWPFSYYALIGVVGLMSYGLTVVAVAGQRRGDGQTPMSLTVIGGFPERLVNLFRFPCPTTSATRAQVWFELKAQGLPVLTIGLALAIVIPLLLVVTTRLDVVLSTVFTGPATRLIALTAAVFSLPTVLVLGGNAFGMRFKQGRSYAGAFEATQACGTAQMAGLKVLVRSLCLLASLTVVGASVWTSASVIPFDVLADNDTFIEKSRAPLSGWMRVIQANVEALSGLELLALAGVVALGVVFWVAWWAAIRALWTSYPRHMSIAASLFLLYGLAFVLLVLANRASTWEIPLGTLVRATGWIAAVSIVLATAYLAWRTFMEQLMTGLHAAVAILLSAVFAAAWLTLLRAMGVSLTALPATDAAWMLTPMLLPLTIAVLALWSYSRVRHT